VTTILGFTEISGMGQLYNSAAIFHKGAIVGVFGRMTKAITERYLSLEARGLKARSENPEFRHAGAASGSAAV
jgi:hypothetical protein